jgi:hypothetical protein
MLNICYHQGNENQNQNEISSDHSQTTINKYTKISANQGVKKRETVHAFRDKVN